jgi:hypothetical protein
MNFDLKKDKSMPGKIRDDVLQEKARKNHGRGEASARCLRMPPLLPRGGIWPAAVPAAPHQLSHAPRQLLRFPGRARRPPRTGWRPGAGQPRSRRYRQASVSEVLRRLLPPGLASALPPRLTRPQIVGDIGVIRLDEASQLRHSRFLALAGQVVLEKNPQLRTVALESALSPEQAAGGGRDTYSLGGWQIVAGIASFRTTVSEHGLRLSVDLGSSFWNGKRADERRRLAAEILDHCAQQQQQQQPAGRERSLTPLLVCDMTAGVGALAVRIVSCAAARSLPVAVLANDWNPAACELIKHNRAQNALTKAQLEATSLSVGDLARALAAQPERWRHAGAVLILDAPRPEGIGALLADLRPLLRAHAAACAAAAADDVADTDLEQVGALRLVLYAMAPPSMLTPTAWHARLERECADEGRSGGERSQAVAATRRRLHVGSVVPVRSVGKGWELVCVSATWQQRCGNAFCVPFLD